MKYKKQKERENISILHDKLCDNLFIITLRNVVTKCYKVSQKCPMLLQSVTKCYKSVKCCYKVLEKCQMLLEIVTKMSNVVTKC